ncbi:hypothetical protein LCGC14_1445620 [marine sediment metagenome]|uniref:Uncharacterized protein n=1 Tax=marine sediment metagenome TaxID=412755 RepID=A0A0F9K5K6_9ZZZZ
MNELEYSAIRARSHKLHSTNDDIVDHPEWCFCVGLWETLGWISDEDRSKVFGWLILE